MEHYSGVPEYCRILTPLKDVHILLPRTQEYVALHGKRDFADVVKVTNIEMGRLSWISR